MAEAVRSKCYEEWSVPEYQSIRDVDLRAVIEALPEPEPVPAPTGRGMCAQTAAHTAHSEPTPGWCWARDRKTLVWHMARVAFPRPSLKGDDVLIASAVSGFSNTLRNRRDFDAWIPLTPPEVKP